MSKRYRSSPQAFRLSSGKMVVPRSQYAVRTASVSAAAYFKKRRPTTAQLTTRIPRGLGNPVAQRTFTWLNYSEDMSFTSAAGGVGVDYQFNLNSIFDPDRSGVGHQPYGHDTYQTLYQRYRVHKCKYIVSGVATSTNATRLTVAPLNNVTAQNSSSQIEEQSSVYRTKNMYYTGSSNFVFTGLVDLATLNGVSASEYKSDDRFESNFGSSPTELMALHCIVSGLTGGVASVAANVKLSFYCEFTDPVQLAQS